MTVSNDAFDLVYVDSCHGVQCTNSSVAKSLAFQESILILSKVLPDADPHVRWCGGWGLKTHGYPLLPSSHFRVHPSARNTL